MTCKQCNHPKATHSIVGICMIDDCSCGDYEAEEPPTVRYTDYESQIRRTLANKTGNLLAEKNTEIEQLRAALTQQAHAEAQEARIETLEANNAKLKAALENLIKKSYRKDPPYELVTATNTARAALE